MRKVLIIVFCCITALFAHANDGVFYAEGNHLIPITETDISVQKEVLTLNRAGDKIQVTVYYEFYNPTVAKEVLVGFEADAHGHAPSKTFPQHPHISNFKVVMNGEALDYDIAHVEVHYENGRKVKVSYVKDGHIEGMTLEQCMKEWDALEADEAICDFVYHFNAHFRPGLNIIQHTYDFDLSYQQVYSDKGYEGNEDFFPYILTAANRWANHQIDDFTLIVNMGDRTSFHISPSFFESAGEWTFQGTGKYSVNTIRDGKEYSEFHVKQGGIKLHKENFHPDGELLLNDLHSYFYFDVDNTSADNILETVKNKFYSLHITDYTLKNKKESIYDTYTSEQRRILKNLPFAYRGYIFKDKSLQEYFESANWYIPDPQYRADVEKLSEDEQKWVKLWLSSDSIDNTRKKQIEDRVNSMYKHVFSEYLKSRYDLPTTNFDSIYYSQEFYHLDRMIGSIENQLGEPIIHDADYWVWGQDWCDDLSVRVLNVEMLSGKKAKVTINHHNCNDRQLTLVMVYERNNWFIDDMIDQTSMRQGIIEELESFKKEGIEPRGK
ncbi:MAG: YARHG domain-containing protein [Bacteroidaceae bacterium]|nr:YARHG domain-containing protein [Bacteroidaceae bacterium]